MDNEPTGAEPTETDVTPVAQESTAEAIYNQPESGSVIEPNQTTETVAPVAPVSASVMTPQEIAQIASQTAMQTNQQYAANQQAQQQQQQAQQPRQYTPEELNLFQVDETLFNQIFGSDDPTTAIQAMNNMLQGVAKQAFTMAQLHNQQELDQRFNAYDQRINPHIAFAQEQQEAQMAQVFFNEHKDLAGMDQVVSQVTAGLRQEGRQFASQKELFAEVATRTKAIIQHISGGQQAQSGVGAGQASQQVTQPTTQKPAMATVGAGGTGGAGGGQGASSGKPNAAKSIFGG